jgi:cytochrome P450
MSVDVEAAQSRAPPVLQDLDDPTFDPFAMEEQAHGGAIDPYPRLHALMRQGAVHPFPLRSQYMEHVDATTVGRETVSIVGFDAVQQVLLQPYVFSNSAYELTLGLSFGDTLTRMDAPEHTRYRRIFQKAFLPNTVRSWSEQLVEPVVTGLVDRFVGRGHADLVAEFTLHYPFEIIYRQLGLPPEHQALFQKLAVTQTTYHVSPATAAEAGRKLGDYFVQMVRDRRANPRDDLPTLLSTAEVEGERLPENIVVSFLRQLMNAGGDTTYRGTGTLLLGLLTHPEQLEAVRRDRSLVPQAIEEALRWDGPVGVMMRQVASDTVFDGVELKAGALVDVVASSANRDARVYDDPDRFDIFREPRKHLAFATGPHVCIGQHLARVEMERALTQLLDRLPNLKLDPDKPAPANHGYTMRCPRRLHVRFDT